MTMSVACPGCAKQLAVAPELIGQVLGCPHCHAQFQVAAPAPAGAAATSGSTSAPSSASTPLSPVSANPAPAAAPAASGTAPRWRGDASLSSGFKLNDPAPAAPAQPAVPKFKPADPTTTIVTIAADGKLPELALAEAASRPKAAAAEGKKPRPVLLTLVLGLSLALSVVLSLVDFSPVDADASAEQQARLRISRFYQEDGAALEPYQLLLRDAQRSHSRGDHEAERAKYREVLRLLRAENRATSLTESRDADRELEQAIAIALRET